MAWGLRPVFPEPPGKRPRLQGGGPENDTLGVASAPPDFPEEADNFTEWLASELNGTSTGEARVSSRDSQVSGMLGSAEVSDKRYYCGCFGFL